MSHSNAVAVEARVKQTSRASNDTLVLLRYRRSSPWKTMRLRTWIFLRRVIVFMTL